MAKDTVFYGSPFFRAGKKLIRAERPLVMGILNLTPDSFYAGSRLKNIEAALEKARQMIAEGADLLDVGGYSSRPGAAHIAEAEELDRVIPVIEALCAALPDIPVSIDTFRSRVAQAAVNAGATLINDIGGGRLDPDMFATVAALQVPYILMHSKGTPQTMQDNPQYDDLIGEMIRYFSEKIGQLHRLGVNDIWIDPGIGFGKTTAGNFQLIRELDRLKILEKPLLIGVSRKSFIRQALGVETSDSLNGSTVMHTAALLNGASVLRVHDVKEAKEAVKLISAYHSCAEEN